MNAKLMGVAAGLVLLGGSGMAVADGWKARDHWKERDDRGRGGWEERDRNDNGRHEGWHRGPPHWHQHHHHHHYYPGWHEPRGYYPHEYRSGWGPGYGYGHDDGVTIIFKGRLD